MAAISTGNDRGWRVLSLGPAVAVFVLLDQVKYTEFGAVPVRADLLRSDLVKRHKFRFLQAFSENSKWGVNILPVKEGAQINAIMDLRLNQVLTGELSSIGALNKAAREIRDIMRKAGYKTGRIADLK